MILEYDIPLVVAWKEVETGHLSSIACSVNKLDATVRLGYEDENRN